jgi:hypothetical protein
MKQTTGADMEEKMCLRCILTTKVPGVTLDRNGICNICHKFDNNKDIYENYFKTENELEKLLEKCSDAQLKYDVLLMYSGGKDSTYVLFRLVDMGIRVLALTFDNGYIPQACFNNIKEVCENVGVDNIVVSVPKAKMDKVFVKNLREDSSVCSGCFRGLTARGVEVAVRERIPIIITGLSRGQIYDTKLHTLINNGITDPGEIDDYLLQFREVYHSVNDEVSQLIDDRALEDIEAFRKIQYVDFYRYSSATKKDIVNLLEERAPFWKKPDNVGGCSSNCMINDVGIHVHLKKKGFHSYAIPTSWEIRFGHVSREEALREISPLSKVDVQRVERIIQAINL